LSVWLVGCSCHTHHGGHSGSHQLDWGKEIPPGSLPDPPGVHLQRFQATQRNNAITMEYAIFLHEWQNGGRALGPYGEHHLSHIIRRLGNVPYPVLVQPTHDPEINEFRRNVIVAKLLEAGIHDAEQRVLLRNPEAEGLFGDEAPRVYQRLLMGNMWGGGMGGMGGMGGFGGGFGGFGGGFGGGGFGGFGGGFGGFGF
jgi:uncharacterized membrane protein YgcG